MTSGHASVKLRCAPGPTVVVNILRTDGANVAGALDRAACLFFGDVADYGQFEHLALIRLDKEEQPDREFRDRDQRPNKQAEQSHEGNRGDHRKSNPEDDASHAEEEGLKGVETDKTVTVVGLHHEENDRRNESDIGEKARNVIGEASRRRARSGCHCRASSCRLGVSFSAGTTSHGTFGHCCSTRSTKSRHSSSSAYQSNVGRTLAEARAENNGF